MCGTRQRADRLRSGLTKAVGNLFGAVDSGDPRASIALLNAVDLYGNGAMNHTQALEPEALIRPQAEAQAGTEGVARKSLTAMAEHMNTAAWRHRGAEVEAELRRTSAEAEPLEPNGDRLRRPPPSTTGSAPGRDALATDS